MLLCWRHCFKCGVNGRWLVSGRAARRALSSASQQDEGEVVVRRSDEQKRFGDVVYVGGMNKMVKRLKVFTLTTSSSAAFLQAFVIGKVRRPLPSLRASRVVFRGVGLFGGGMTAAGVSSVTIFCIFFFFTPLLINWITRRYVTHIYLDRATRTFTSVRWDVFVRRRALRWTALDVEEGGLGETGSARLTFASVLVRGRPLLVDLAPSAFADRDAFELMISNCESLKLLVRLQKERQRRVAEGLDDDEDDDFP